VPKHTGEVIRSGSKSKGRVIDRINEPLNRPVEIRSGRVDEKKMVETFRYQSPAANQRIAQNECGIVPDKIVAHSRRIADEDNNDQD